jgi:death-on-curing protein
VTIEYLSSRDVVWLAESELGTYVGTDAAALDEATGLPRELDGERDRYPGVHLKAAALFHELLRRRLFPQGNERIALLSAIVFLSMNGQDVTACDDDLVELTRLTAQGQLTLLTVAAAFEAATVRLPAADLQGV